MKTSEDSSLWETNGRQTTPGNRECLPLSQQQGWRILRLFQDSVLFLQNKTVESRLILPRVHLSSRIGKNIMNANRVGIWCQDFQKWTSKNASPGEGHNPSRLHPRSTIAFFGIQFIMSLTGTCPASHLPCTG